MARLAVEFENADGDILELTEFTDEVEVVKGLSGFGMPPVTINSQAYVGRAGSVITNVRHEPRIVGVPLVINTIANESVSTEAIDLLLNKLESMARILDPAKGEGILRVTSANGLYTSELGCYYTGGFEIDNLANLAPNAQNLTLAFLAGYPYWLGQEESVSFVDAEGGDWFPMTPFPRLGANSVLANFSVTSTSAVDIHPRIYIHGSGSSITITNNRTQRVLEFANIELGVSDYLEIDMDEKTIWKTITDVKTNAFPDATQIDLWPLLPGENSISIAISNTSSSTYATFNWRDATMVPRV
jgi:phage-related protein